MCIYTINNWHVDNAIRAEHPPDIYSQAGAPRYYFTEPGRLLDLVYDVYFDGQAQLSR